MKGDYSRTTFDPSKRYSGVRQQQGRVLLDADWNEQQDILDHRLELAAIDQLGRCVVPTSNDLKIERFIKGPKGFDMHIAPGRAYVEGRLVELRSFNEESSEEFIYFTEQPDRIGATMPTEPGTYLAYLEVWRHHITVLEDPDLAEVALGGPDTTTRTQTLGQVRLAKVATGSTCADFAAGWTPADLRAGGRPTPGKLSARVTGSAALENQLYRVEVHQEGDQDSATFKWSRDNGVVVATVEKIDTNENIIFINQTFHDEERKLEVNQFVELTDEQLILEGWPGKWVGLTEVKDLELRFFWPDESDATIPAEIDVTRSSPPRNQIVRGWSSQGAVPMRPKVSTEVTGVSDGYIPLEDGIEVYFEEGWYRTGDYWLIPSRREINSVLWPTDSNGAPLAVPPHGIRRDYIRCHP
jgi:hypothetical protein